MATLRDQITTLQFQRLSLLNRLQILESANTPMTGLISAEDDRIVSVDTAADDAINRVYPGTVITQGDYTSPF